VTNKYEHERE
jgi:kinesin family member 5